MKFVSLSLIASAAIVTASASLGGGLVDTGKSVNGHAVNIVGAVQSASGLAAGVVKRKVLPGALRRRVTRRDPFDLDSLTDEEIEALIAEGLIPEIDPELDLSEVEAQEAELKRRENEEDEDEDEEDELKRRENEEDEDEDEEDELKRRENEEDEDEDEEDELKRRDPFDLDSLTDEEIEALIAEGLIPEIDPELDLSEVEAQEAELKRREYEVDEDEADEDEADENENEPDENENEPDENENEPDENENEPDENENEPDENEANEQ